MLPDIKHRLRSLFRRRAVERELDEELQFHIANETEKNIRLGMSPADARRRALIAFGGVERIKDDVRDSRGVSMFETLMQDLRYAARGMRAAPGFTAAVVLTLGLGIGANAAMFGILDRLMFRSPAFLRDPSHVHLLYLNQTARGEVRQINGYEYTRFLDLERWTSSFSNMTPFAERTMAVGDPPNAREARVAAVGGGFFELFDAQPTVGRFFGKSEDQIPRGADVAVLSYGFWQTNYGGREDVVGSRIQLGPAHFTIIGVAPKNFAGISDDRPPVAYVPITTFAANAGRADPSNYYTTYNWGWLDVLARRKPGVSIQAANADLTQAYRKSWDAEAAMSPGITPKDVALPRAVVGPLQESRGPRAGANARVMKWISGVALIVLIIASANVANLLLARALRRRREIAVRLALGASRARLMSQLLTEAIFLALLGGAAGLLFAHWGGSALRTLFLPEGAVAGTLADKRTIIFAAIAALLTGVMSGLAPLLHAGRDDLVTSLKTGTREGAYRSSRTRTGLLIFQGALSVVLLVGAGLFVRSLQNVRQMRLGFDIEPLLYVTANARGTKITPDDRAELFRRLEEEARSIPGVENASRSLTVPFRNTWSQSLFVPGIDSVRKLGSFTLQGGSSTFFQTAGTRILRGRGISAEDRAGAPKVVVVSEAMAKTLWPGREALGQCMRMNADTTPCITVVGVAENMRQNSLAADDAQLHYYLPIEQFNPHEASLYVRTRGPAAKQVALIRQRLQTLMPGAAYVNVTPMSTIVGARQRSWKMGATMFVAFGGLALTLAALGLYSVIAYEVAQRKHELGVRVALGADRGDIMGLVFRQALSFVAAGVVIGGAIALFSVRWVSDLLFNVSPRDPLVYGAVGLVLLLVAVLASAVPALRAARVDPIIALRFD